MICECGNTINENAAFCSKCGKKIEKQEQVLFCTNCGSKVKIDAVFCDSCGNRVNLKNEQVVNEVSKLIMSLDGLSLYKGKQPIGILKVYNDKVEFVHSGKNFTSSFLVGGMIGAMIASGTSKQTDIVDTFTMSEIAIANKSKHPKISSYIEIVLKNGNKMKYLDRAGKYRAEQMFAFVDAINANL